MHTTIDGKNFTVSITMTRWKVLIGALIVMTIVWLPYHFLQNANVKITLLEKQKTVTPMLLLNIKEPIVSPYALSADAKSVLNAWLLYGLNNGYDKMLEHYTEITKNKNDYKPFLYVIESEWRLGHWDNVK